MRAHQYRPQPDRKEVGNDVLYRVGVDRDDASGGCPFMMNLMHMLV